MSKESQHILVLRFSAMGDVALIAPVVRSFSQSFPAHKITIVSRPRFSVFFKNINNVNFFPADVDNTFAGPGGIIRLFNRLRELKPDRIIDLHDHIRSRIVCFLFRLSGIPIARFDKGRKEKKQLTRKENKVRNQLPHTVNRYRAAFHKAGFNFSLVNGPYLEPGSEAETQLEKWLNVNGLIKTEAWIGLAPFAAHKTKIWPNENYFKLIESSLTKSKSKFFLFGGGSHEIAFFEKLRERFPDHCIIIAGKVSMEVELALIKRLDKMLCVDSGNMHLAALIGTPTLSIWGGTHSDTGFGPFGLNNELIEISTDTLACRPCSVYGKSSCWRGDFACLNEITVERVLTRLNKS